MHTLNLVHSLGKRDECFKEKNNGTQNINVLPFAYEHHTIREEIIGIYKYEWFMHVKEMYIMYITLIIMSNTKFSRLKVHINLLPGAAKLTVLTTIELLMEMYI